MDLDLTTTLKIASLIGSGVMLWKFYSEVLLNKRVKLRQDYVFAKAFMEDLVKSPSMHPYVREKGFQALAGDSNLNAEEIEYLLSLPNSANALSLYVSGRSLLKHQTTAIQEQLTFRGKYRSKSYRTFRKYVYATLYALTYFLATAPLLDKPLNILTTEPSVSAFAVTAVIFLPMALYCLVKGRRILSAEKLVRMQISANRGI